MIFLNIFVLLADSTRTNEYKCNRYSRQNILALGKFSLNISDIPENLGEIQNFEYVPALYRFLSHLLEKSVYLPLTIDYLNNTTMIPK